jgi:hypothetical protein
LPAWFAVWFVIGLGLFGRESYRQVFRWLAPYRKGGTPGRSTLCEARHRLGVALLRRLYEAVVVLLGKPDTPGAFYGGMRLMAIDGFVVDLPDTEQNERAFGRPGTDRAAGAFPQARVLSLCETGSHVLWRSLIKPCHRGENPMAHYLLRFLEKDMLLLWDRNFFSYATLTQVRSRQAQLLARIKKNLVFEPLQQLADGSYLAKAYRSTNDRRHNRDGILVRIKDVLAYLLAALDLPTGESQVFEIGSSDVVTYGQLIQEYARQRGLRRWLISVPLLTPYLSSLWLGLVTPASAEVGRHLIEGLKNPTIVRDKKALDVFSIRPVGIKEAMKQTLEEAEQTEAK